MSTRDFLFHALLRRIRDFLIVHLNLLQLPTDSPERRALDQAVHTISNAVVARSLSEVAEEGIRVRIRELRHDIRVGGMQPIVVTARMYLRHLILEHDALRVPKKRSGYPELVYAARSLAGLANHYRDAFDDAGLPLHVIEQLGEDAAELQQLVEEVARLKRGRQRAAFVIAAEHKRARAALAVLDTHVSRALTTHPGLAARWARIKQVTGHEATVYRLRRRAAA